MPLNFLSSTHDILDFCFNFYVQNYRLKTIYNNLCLFVLWEEIYVKIELCLIFAHGIHLLFLLN